MSTHTNRLSRRTYRTILVVSLIIVVSAVIIYRNYTVAPPVAAPQEMPVMDNQREVEAADVPKESNYRQQPVDSVVSPTPAPDADKKDAHPIMTVSPTASATFPAVDEAGESVHTSIQAAYLDKLANLQDACANKAGGIVKELSAEVQAGQKEKEGFSVSDLQSKFLPKIQAAEQGCDAEFNSLVSSAEKEYREKGLPVQDIEGWKSQYDAAKRRVQQQAVEALLSYLSR